MRWFDSGVGHACRLSHLKPKTRLIVDSSFGAVVGNCPPFAADTVVVVELVAEEHKNYSLAGMVVVAVDIVGLVVGIVVVVVAFVVGSVVGSVVALHTECFGWVDMYNHFVG